MKRIILILLLGFAVVTGFSQSYYVSISGTITDVNTGNPVPDHEVMIFTGDGPGAFISEVHTNENGFYTDTMQVANGGQGVIYINTGSCNGCILDSGFYSPSDTNIIKDFSICLPDCEALFSYYKTGGDSLTLHFMDESQGNPTRWFWDFGDGETSQEQNPVHTYAQKGSYLVLLKITSPTNPPDSCRSSEYHRVYAGFHGGDLCNSWFNYEVMPNGANTWVALFEAYTYSSYPTVFTWDFGDGTTGEGQSVSHTYTQAGMYQVTLSSVDSVGCPFQYTEEIQIDDSATLTLGGTVALDSGFVADYATVYLMTIDSGTNRIEVAQTETADGEYRFSVEGLLNQTYYIQAELNENSAYYGDFVPTYYQQAVNWQNASPVYPLIYPGPNYDIMMQHAAGTAPGNGTISGVIDGDLTREFPANIEVLLLDENNNVLTYTRSDEEGRFGFENLAYGTYVVYTEIFGVNTIPGYITLSESNPTADITVNVANGEAVLGMKENGFFVRNVSEIFPNPVTSSSNIDITLNAATQLNLSIVNQVGEKINGRVYKLSEGNHRLQLDVDQLPAGIYFVTIVPQDGVKIVRKFVKTE